jgi:nitroreductase
LIGAALGIGVGGISRPAPANAASMTYAQAVDTTWAPLQMAPRDRELVRFATLAANSHNTQPWTFSVNENEITIAPDFNRRCPAVDPDDHHLFASLGCAVENLTHAAAAFGLRATPTLVGDRLVTALEPAPPMRSPLFDAIPVRQSSRSSYDGKPVPADNIRLLEQAGREPGVSLIIMTDRARISNVVDYVVQGNSLQMHDAAFMTELKNWLRFSEADAVATMDGLFSRTSGNPAMPAWLAKPLLPLLFTEDRENKKYRDHIESSAGIAVFVSEADDRAHWVAAGRACQRFGLQATALGLKYAFINQPVEVPALRPQFASYLGVGSRRPDIVLRFGARPELPRSLRRPPEQVMRPAA